MSIRDRYYALVKRMHITLALMALTVALCFVIIIVLIAALGPQIDNFMDELILRYGIGVISWPAIVVFLGVLYIKIKKGI